MDERTAVSLILSALGLAMAFVLGRIVLGLSAWERAEGWVEVFVGAEPAARRLGAVLAVRGIPHRLAVADGRGRLRLEVPRERSEQARTLVEGIRRRQRSIARR